MSTSLHNRSLFIAQCVLCIASLIYSPRIYIMYKKLRLYYVRDCVCSPLPPSPLLPPLLLFLLITARRESRITRMMDNLYCTTSLCKINSVD